MNIEFWKMVVTGLVELIKVSGPYIVAVLSAVFGYLINKNSKEMSITLAELQKDKDLNLQKEKHDFDERKCVSKRKKELADKIIKELEPIYTSSLLMINTYYVMCSSGEVFNSESFNNRIYSRFFSDQNIKDQADIAIARASAYIGVFSEVEIILELMKLRDSIYNCIDAVDFKGESWGDEHSEKVKKIIYDLPYDYITLFSKLGDSIQ